MNTNFTDIQISYHRNGICGLPFYVVLFTWQDGSTSRRMMATVFDETNAIAVLDVNETAKGNVAFGGGNSWRGDHFETELRALIAARDMEAAA